MTLSVQQEVDSATIWNALLSACHQGQPQEAAGEAAMTGETAAPVSEQSLAALAAQGTSISDRLHRQQVSNSPFSISLHTVN